MNERSRFVTIVAWVFIGLAINVIFISIIQYIMSHFMPQQIDLTGFDKPVTAVDSLRFPPPDFSVFAIKHMREIATGNILAGIGALLISIGLLKRLRWARISFIVLLILVIITQLISIFLPFAMFPKLPNVPDPHVLVRFKAIAYIMFAFIGVLNMGTCGVYVWVIKKLTTSGIKAEFIN